VCLIVTRWWAAFPKKSVGAEVRAESSFCAAFYRAYLPCFVFLPDLLSLHIKPRFHTFFLDGLSFIYPSFSRTLYYTFQFWYIHPHTPFVLVRPLRIRNFYCTTSNLALPFSVMSSHSMVSVASPTTQFPLLRKSSSGFSPEVDEGRQILNFFSLRSDSKSPQQHHRVVRYLLLMPNSNYSPGTRSSFLRFPSYLNIRSQSSLCVTRTGDPSPGIVMNL
jgi:hypothetical protein